MLLTPLRWLTPILAVTAASAAPPTTLFLEPNRHTVGAGESVELRFLTGATKDAQPTAWPAEEIAWMLVRGGPTQENRHDVRPARAGDNFVAVEVKHAGVTVIGIDRRPAIIDLTAAELRAYLKDTVPPSPATRNLAEVAPDKKLRVRHIASAKTLVRAGTDAAGSALAVAKTGQGVELLPLLDPTAAPPGSDLPLVTYIDGAKVAGLHVQATHVATGRTASFFSDAGGSGYFPLSEAGVWRVELHHAEPLVGDPGADWAVYNATLTFEVRAKGGAR